MKALVLLAAAAVLALAGPAVAQDKKQLAIVVKGLDNPFFESIHQGCEKWNAEHADSQYECFYTGPASTSDEAGEAQILSDLLAKPTTGFSHFNFWPGLANLRAMERKPQETRKWGPVSY